MWKVYTRSLIIYAIILFVPTALHAADPKNLFNEGQDYIKLDATVRTKPDVEQLLMADPHKIQVVMFFNYGCHGCDMFHKPFDKWVKEMQKKYPNKIATYVYPVSFNPQWKMLAKMYYVDQALDPSGKLTDAIFEAAHKKGLKLWEVSVMQKFFVQHGYTVAQFDQAYNAFNVNRQVKRADDVSKAYGIIATPDLIINGPVNSYKIDFAKAGNDVDRLMKILDYLVNKEVKLLPSK